MWKPRAAFAARVLRECNGAPEERMVRVWQLALQRNPREEEVKTMLALLEMHRNAYRADPKAAEELLKSASRLFRPTWTRRSWPRGRTSLVCC